MPKHKLGGVRMNGKEAGIERSMVNRTKHEPISSVVASVLLLRTEVCSVENSDHTDTTCRACRPVSFQDGEFKVLLARPEIHSPALSWHHFRQRKRLIFLNVYLTTGWWRFAEGYKECGCPES
jgi:hypothetical protein